MGCCASKDDKDNLEVVLSGRKGCTDPICCCIFLLFWIIFLLIFAFGLFFGQPQKYLPSKLFSHSIPALSTVWTTRATAAATPSSILVPRNSTVPLIIFVLTFTILVSLKMPPSVLSAYSPHFEMLMSRRTSL